MTFFDCTADLVRQMTGNGQKGLSYRLTHPLWKISGYATGLSQLSTASAACGSRQVCCWAPRRQQIDRSIAGAGVQQQRRRSTALSRKCGMRTVSCLQPSLKAEHRRTCFHMPNVIQSATVMHAFTNYLATCSSVSNDVITRGLAVTGGPRDAMPVNNIL